MGIQSNLPACRDPPRQVVSVWSATGRTFVDRGTAARLDLPAFFILTIFFVLRTSAQDMNEPHRILTQRCYAIRLLLACLRLEKESLSWRSCLAMSLPLVESGIE